MGIIKICGIFINLDRMSTWLSSLCRCCKRQRPVESPKYVPRNDPAAFLIAAAKAKAKVKRIPR